MSTKLFTREDAVALFQELLTAAIAEGKTCSTMATKNEHVRFLAAQEAAAIANELADRANEAPIPPWTAITLSRTSSRSKVKTATVYEPGPNGYRVPVGGGFEITKDGNASRQEMPAADVAQMQRDDREFAALVESGDLVLTPLTEAEARPLEIHARRFRRAGATMAATGVGTPQFTGFKSGTFHG